MRFLQGEKLIIEWPEYFCAQRGELGLYGLELTHDPRAKLAHALRQNNAIFAEEPPDLIHQWVNGCRRCRNHSGSLKPHWKEVGPFHYNPRNDLSVPLNHRVLPLKP